MDYLASLGTTITDGLTKFKDVIVASLTVGSTDKPMGITLYDEDTGEPYCVKVKSGAMVSLAGACELASAGSSTSDVTEVPTSDVVPLADTTPPMITIIGANPAEIEMGATYGDLGVTVSDNVDSNLGYTASLDSGPELSQGDGLALDTSAPGTHTITYKATDSTGNTSMAERTVNVTDPGASATEEESASTTPNE
ncbi:MAG: hypothetical protein A3J00_00630 [Candidatus Niyogibacteria bacterium RIFCSPLOWO2_02_FULL_45_13]|uniref:Pesticidal crystal protein Cry22Aa Ig-like domain-containing protein n=1 Tax=Candidatus Niyogibacteria bacterium RIFCSPLOWO2_02_FULL_45_13 TaxID=1801725 RepID=A0A1G2EZ36_9BACT|nr:MAG: hypothetical protein A3J00_00630 [Candidatus Niyogibacteria bacterium RIFCSPLOWO2_02_FULL_45_13]